MCSIMGYCSEAADYARFKNGFDRTISRGPDDSRIVDTGNGLLGFHRLAIMGLQPEGMQPFALDGSYVVCNGEIYGFETLKQALQEKGYTFQSGSDCEILLPLYREYGVEMFRMLDAEFALILYDGDTKSYIAARDPIGIRPLYYGYDPSGTIVFASEPKNLVGLCEKIMPFPPGHYYKDGKFVCYRDITAVKEVCRDDLDTVCTAIREKLIAGIKKRLVSDAKVGFLLSGGLDSSLVCAVAQKCSDRPIRTFAIGMSEDAIDLKYAREVADYIGSQHTEVYMTPEEVLDSLKTVIALLGTYDITTIRASMGMYLVCKAIHEQTDIRVLLTGEISDELFGYKYIRTFAIGMSEDAIDLKYAREVADYIGSQHTEVYMTPEEVLDSLETVIALLGTYDITTIRASMGMYLVCKAIHEQTDIRVLLTGEISDELFGYKYTDFAPSAEEFQKEAVKRIRELHMYDVLRADRCVSVNSLEARVPFGDLDFVEYVMGIDPERKLNKYGKGKYLLRRAFEGDYLPHSILYREKAAFSDAVGHSMVDYLKDYAERRYTDEEFEKKRLAYGHARPFTKESLLYREIFEAYYPGQSGMIVDFWMPNRSWKGCNVNDPSARVLANYGDSGK